MHLEWLQESGYYDISLIRDSFEIEMLISNPAHTTNESSASYKVDRYLGVNLARHRRQAGIPLTEMADRLAENVAYYSALEAGQVEFTVQVLVKASQACGVPVARLIETENRDFNVLQQVPDILSSISIGFVAAELRTLEDSKVFGWFCDFLKIERPF